MFYGIVTQTCSNYTEYQLRQYPQKRQRTEDGAKPITERQARPLRQLMLSLGHVHAGGIGVVTISQADADRALS